MLRLAIDELSISFTIGEDFVLRKLENWNIICKNFMYRIAKNLKFKDKPELAKSNLIAYDITYNYGSVNPIKFGYHSVNVKSGMTLKFHAVALGKYLEYSGISVMELLRIVQSTAQDRGFVMRVRRIDLVVDYINENIISVDSIYKGLRNGSIEILDKNENINRSSINSFENNFKTNTIYVGQKKTSERFMRIYDKKVEQLTIGGVHYEKAKEYKQWIRFEASYKKNLATQLGEMILEVITDKDLISFIAGQILQKYQFYKNGKRMNITTKLSEMVEFPVVSPLLEYNKNNDLAKLMDYFLVGDSGLQGLLYQIRILEGVEAMNSYISDIIDYQMNEYQPSENIKEKIKKYQKKDEE